MATAFCPKCGTARPVDAAFCPRCGAPYEPPAPSPQPVPASAAPARLALSPTAILAVVAGVLAAVGAFLPWATVSSGFLSLSKSGVEGDGVFTAGAGAVAALYGLLRAIQPALVTTAVRILLLIIAAFIGWVGITDLGSVTRAVAGLDESILGSIGIGLYVTIFSAILLAVAAILPNRTA